MTAAQQAAYDAALLSYNMQHTMSPASFDELQHQQHRRSSRRQRREHRDRHRRPRQGRHKRSVTVSPSPVRHEDWTNEDYFEYSKRRSTSPTGVHQQYVISPEQFYVRKPDLPKFARRRLRKTFSEPSDLGNDSDEPPVDPGLIQAVQVTRPRLSSGSTTPRSAYRRTPSSLRRSASPTHAVVAAPPEMLMQMSVPGMASDAIEQSYRQVRGRFGLGASHESTPDEADIMSTDIEELIPAAMSIDILARSARQREKDLQREILRQHFGGSKKDRTPYGQFQRQRSTERPAPHKHGVTTRLGGQPRGMIQFLPKVKSSDQMFLPKEMSMSMYGAVPLQHSSSAMYSRRQSADNGDPLTALLSSSARSSGGESSSTMEDVLVRSAHAAAAVKNHGMMPLTENMQLRQSQNDVYRPSNQKARHATFAAARSNSSVTSSTSKRFGRQASQSETPQSLLIDPESGEPITVSVNRFQKLLQAFKTSRTSTPERVMSPTRHHSRPDRAASDSSPTPSTDASVTHHRIHPHPRVVQLSDRPSCISPQHFGASDSESSACVDSFIWDRRSQSSLKRAELKRHRIVQEICETEKSYVEKLQMLYDNYIKPLKSPQQIRLIDSSIVDQIFLGIPELLKKHTIFLKKLILRMEQLESTHTLDIGDVIFGMFTMQGVVDVYTGFIENFRNAKAHLAEQMATNEIFAKYVEQRGRENKSRLSLDDLLIMPVQRIPRYKLLLENLLRHTPTRHPDYERLLDARSRVHALAVKINAIQAEVGHSKEMQQRLREIEAIIHKLDDLVAPHRIFYRYDPVFVSNHEMPADQRKQRCLFLFSDQLIITSVKPKHKSSRSDSDKVASNTSNFLESHHFRLEYRISLEDLEISSHSLERVDQVQKEMSSLRQDLNTVNEMMKLMRVLRKEHEEVASSVSKLKNDLRGNIENLETDPALLKFELSVTNEYGVESFTVWFPKAETRLAWESRFVEAKEALEYLPHKRPPPLFMKYVRMQLARQGLKLICAATTPSLNRHGYPDIWLCSHDLRHSPMGQTRDRMGQISVLSMTPHDLCEMAVLNAATCPTCAITVLCAVPDHKDFAHRPAERRRMSVEATTSRMEFDSDHSDDDSNDSQEKRSDSGVAVSPPKRPGKGSLARSQTVSPTSDDESDSIHGGGGTMWVGNDDGSICVYNSSVDTSKKQARLKDSSTDPALAAVTAVVYTDEKMFVAYGAPRCEIMVFPRTYGTWAMHASYSLPRDIFITHFAIPATEVQNWIPPPITNMVVAANKVWACCANKILVLSPVTLEFENSFEVSSDTLAVIRCVTVLGISVWISLQDSAVIKLYHALSYECLLEMNVSPTVTKTLAGDDDIIRQHKQNCLHITALHSCKDLLWVGTSAGVILQVAQPHVLPSTKRLNATPTVSASSKGHRGPCRFITSVDLHSVDHGFPLSEKHAELARRRQSLNVAALQTTATRKCYVVSGGDGYENYDVTDNADEVMDNELNDAVNYLLFWQV